MAIFGLHLQLAAAALCLSGSLVAGSQVDARPVLVGSPICHSQGNDQDDDQGSGGGSRDAHGACPFCSLHGQVGLVAAPPQHAASVTAAAAPTEPPGFAARPLSRRPTDAAPRGPPIVG